VIEYRFLLHLEAAMSVRIPLCFRVLIGLAFVAVVGTVRADDPATVKQLQDTVATLQKQIAVLEAKVAALEKQAKDPATKSNKVDEEYVKTMAGALLDSLLAGDSAGLRNKFTKKMEIGIENLFKEGRLHDDEVDKWVMNWNQKMQYKTNMIDKVVVSPDKDEIIVTGTFMGKEAADKATFTLTLVRDKTNVNKWLVDAVAVKAK
jgi:hypothetical protein